MRREPPRPQAFLRGHKHLSELGLGGVVVINRTEVDSLWFFTSARRGELSVLCMSLRHSTSWLVNSTRVETVFREGEGKGRTDRPERRPQLTFSRAWDLRIPSHRTHRQRSPNLSWSSNGHKKRQHLPSSWGTQSSPTCCWGRHLLEA